MILDLISTFGRMKPFGAFGRRNYMIVSAEEYARMYQKDQNSVLGSEIVIPKLGSKSVIPQFKVPINDIISHLEEETFYESAE